MKYIESTEVNKSSATRKAKSKATQKKKDEEADPSPAGHNDDEGAPDELDDSELAETKKKKRRRKNRKKNKAGNLEESDDEQEEAQSTPIVAGYAQREAKVINLEVVGDSCPPEQLTNCLTRLSDQDFDKQINEFARRLHRIELGSSEVGSKHHPKLIPNLKPDWLQRLKSDLECKLYSNESNCGEKRQEPP